MAIRRKRSIGTVPVGAGPKRGKAPLKSIDVQLDRILSKLADLLLRQGYGYQRISKLTKIAFVKAALEIGKQDHPRTSIARIAALTGLTRIEVSNLLKADRVARVGKDSEMNRATRVAHGWITDPQFSDDHGRPLSLTFFGRQGFAQLVRKFSGDIPARAMLIEMKRLGMVRHGADDIVSLTRERPVLARSTVDAIRAIAPWVDLLAEAEKSSEAINLTSKAQQVRIYFESQSQVLATMRELENRRRSFVSSIEHLGSKTGAVNGHELTVSIAVAAAQPKQSRRRRKLGAGTRHGN